MKFIAQQLAEIVQFVKDELLQLDSNTVSSKPNPVKWSKKEILGHLIDSAANNHQRFVRAEAQGNLVFGGYNQDEWVKQQGYQTAEWTDLVTLWTAYNQHLTRVVVHIPQAVLNHQHTKHNLHLIAFRVVPENETTSLHYFICDYVAHLEHHLKQILPNYQAQVLGTDYK